MRDIATVGRLNGGYPLVEGSDWYASLWGLGFGGLGQYTGQSLDAPYGDENESVGNDQDTNPAPSTTGAGPATGTM